MQNLLALGFCALAIGQRTLVISQPVVTHTHTHNAHAHEHTHSAQRTRTYVTRIHAHLTSNIHTTKHTHTAQHTSYKQIHTRTTLTTQRNTRSNYTHPHTRQTYGIHTRHTYMRHTHTATHVVPSHPHPLTLAHLRIMLSVLHRAKCTMNRKALALLLPSQKRNMMSNNNKKNQKTIAAGRIRWERLWLKTLNVSHGAAGVPVCALMCMCLYVGMCLCVVCVFMRCLSCVTRSCVPCVFQRVQCRFSCVVSVLLGSLGSFMVCCVSSA